MQTKIAILRGINVGGHRKILMDELKSMCDELGLKNIKTYIQSGNLIFNSDKQNKEIENQLENAISKTFRFDVPVIVRTKEELNKAIINNPFFKNNADINRLFLTFLKEKPNEENLNKILLYDFEPDQFIIHNTEAYLFINGKFHKSKLTNNFFEKQLKVTATTRNWKTVIKLSELSKNLGAK